MELNKYIDGAYHYYWDYDGKYFTLSKYPAQKLVNIVCKFNFKNR